MKIEKKKIKHWQSSCIIHKILTTFFFAVNKDDMDITTTKNICNINDIHFCFDNMMHIEDGCFISY